MIQDMQLQRLAPGPRKPISLLWQASPSSTAVLPINSARTRSCSYLHHLLVERRLAWRACHQVACGLKFFYVTTLGWDALHLHLPPRTGRRLLPHLMSVEELQRLCTSAPTPGIGCCS